MNAMIIAGLLLVLLSLAYQAGWPRSRDLATANGPKVHSCPQYYATLVALFILAPALIILVLWAWFGAGITRVYIIAQIPTDILTTLDSAGLSAAIQRISADASGYGVVGDLQPFEQSAADALRGFQFITFLAVVAAAASISILTLLYAPACITARLRARNTVEVAITALLMFCSTVAIMTTVGILLSLFSESHQFL
ncbi:MAG: phosphate ABC transporter permease family protein [Candidatus Devosia symbiotica]|nr:phosphate ABC transporter permease family protein [Candidatus Devosia symbiotica]